jgi:plastocyanin
MINQRLFSVVLAVAVLGTSSFLLAITWSANARASLPESIIANPSTADIDVEEAAAEENATSAATNKPIEVTIVEGASTLGNKAFLPESTNVKLGQNVTWTNSDSSIHTVTSGIGPDDPNVATEFDSRALSPGEKFSNVFNNKSLAGTDLTYFCQIHPAMTGTINIDET